MLAHRAAMLIAEIAWMSEFVAAWEAQAPPDEAPPAPLEPTDIPRMKQVVLPQDPDSPHRRATRRVRGTPPSAPTKISAETPTDQMHAPAEDQESVAPPDPPDETR